MVPTAAVGLEALNGISHFLPLAPSYVPSSLASTQLVQVVFLVKSPRPSLLRGP